MMDHTQQSRLLSQLEDVVRDRASTLHLPLEMTLDEGAGGYRPKVRVYRKGSWETLVSLQLDFYSVAKEGGKYFRFDGDRSMYYTFDGVLAEFKRRLEAKTS